MSDLSEEEKSTHTLKATRIVSPSTRHLDFQEEPWNTHRGHNVAREEDITLHRGAVGDTAVTPISQIENSLGGNTPKMWHIIYVLHSTKMWYIIYVLH